MPLTMAHSNKHSILQPNGADPWRLSLGTITCMYSPHCLGPLCHLHWPTRRPGALIGPILLWEAYRDTCPEFHTWEWPRLKPWLLHSNSSGGWQTIACGPDPTLLSAFTQKVLSERSPAHPCLCCLWLSAQLGRHNRDHMSTKLHLHIIWPVWESLPTLLLVTNFQPCSFHGTHKLITKILQHTKNCIFANLTNNRYNFDSLTPTGYCCVGCCHFFIWQSKGKKVSAHSQIARYCMC